MSETLRRIERASLRAWPGAESVSFEGWELRFSDGFTQRANSVQSEIVPTGRELDARVAHCEAWYAARGAACVFRVTTLSDPALDAFLGERGYARGDPTAVLSMDLSAADVGTRREALRERDVEPWLDCYAMMSALTPRARESMRRILYSAKPRQRFGVLEVEDRPVACGMAALDDGLVGLFDIVTAPEHRRQGYGARLVAGLLGWGKEAGATLAYLLVVKANLPALRLYEKLGFSPGYEYWYRTKAGPAA